MLKEEDQAQRGVEHQRPGDTQPKVRGVEGPRVQEDREYDQRAYANDDRQGCKCANGQTGHTRGYRRVVQADTHWLRE